MIGAERAAVVSRKILGNFQRIFGIALYLDGTVRRIIKQYQDDTLDAFLGYVLFRYIKYHQRQALSLRIHQLERFVVGLF